MSCKLATGDGQINVLIGFGKGTKRVGTKEHNAGVAVLLERRVNARV